jgi:hypothetical protein
MFQWLTLSLAEINLGCNEVADTCMPIRVMFREVTQSNYCSQWGPSGRSGLTLLISQPSRGDGMDVQRFGALRRGNETRSPESCSPLTLSEPAVVQWFFLLWRNWIEPKESNVARRPRRALL